MISVSQLKDELFYNPDTGLFKRMYSRTNSKNGRPAGGINSRGYRTIKVLSGTYQAHRLAWFYIFGVWPKDQIDHINGNKDDNRIVNLRECDNRNNCRHRIKASSYLPGVRPQHKRWIARIQIPSKRIHLGTFDTELEAYMVYCRAARKYFGDFAVDSGDGFDESGVCPIK